MIERIRSAVASHRNSVLFIAALACGAVAVFAGQGYLSSRLAAERARLAPKPPRMVDVVVAKRDLAKGEQLGGETMSLRQIPLEYVSSSAIRPDQFDNFVGNRLAYPLRSGEQLVASAIVGGDHLAFSSRVKPGIRALTIAVDEINSISGMLQPGDRIDLLFSARPPGPGKSNAPEATIPLFQNMLVLATGRQVRPGVDERGAQRSYSTVTVEAEPEHAQRLVVAQRSGKLTAVLRNPDDLASIDRKSIDIRQLLEIPAPLAPQVRPRRQLQMIIGGIGRLADQPSLPVLTGRSAPEALKPAAGNGPGSSVPESSVPGGGGDIGDGGKPVSAEAGGRTPAGAVSHRTATVTAVNAARRGDRHEAN